MIKMNKKFGTLILIVFVVAAFAVIYYGYQLLSKETPIQNEGNSASKEDMDFTLMNADGKEISLSDYRGKPVVLNFWASWCPPCKEEMPNFDKLSNQYEATGEVVFLMVNLTDGGRETMETAKAYLADNGFTLNVVFDENTVVANEFGISSIPTTYFIDADGSVQNIIIGALSESNLEMQVTKLLTIKQ
jgi:cytochrome c biogenesis protein CcmG/thiol:disulfide interchange protein DsbE